METQEVQQAAKIEKPRHFGRIVKVITRHDNGYITDSQLTPFYFTLRQNPRLRGWLLSNNATLEKLIGREVSFDIEPATYPNLGKADRAVQAELI